jgi:phosphate transport system substrate-binding protein
MRSLIYVLIFYFALIFVSSAFAQQPERKKVIITGARFSYPLLKKWIEEYATVNAGVEVVIDPRTTSDPANFDLLVEAYEPENYKDKREFITFARFAVVPIANEQSPLAKARAGKGLTPDELRQAYFQDIFADQSKAAPLTEPFTTYTRLQTSGSAFVFASHFGFTQQNILGKAIAGADEHLVKAITKDTQGIGYAPVPVAFDVVSRTLQPGIVLLQIDADGNKKLSADELLPANLEKTLQVLENNSGQIPVGSLQLSIAKHNLSSEALQFLKWVIENGQDDLQGFGFFKPDEKRFQQEKQKFDQLASKR